MGTYHKDKEIQLFDHSVWWEHTTCTVDLWVNIDDFIKAGFIQLQENKETLLYDCSLNWEHTICTYHMHSLFAICGGNISHAVYLQVNVDDFIETVLIKLQKKVIPCDAGSVDSYTRWCREVLLDVA